MRIDRRDRLVLTVADIDRTVRFYCDVLGMEAIVFGGGRTGLKFDRSKINLHQVGHELQPNAFHPSAGSADLCFITDDSLDGVQAELRQNGIPIVEGPVQRTGGLGTLRSVYVRDPDGNLVEISNQLSGQPAPRAPDSDQRLGHLPGEVMAYSATEFLHCHLVLFETPH